MQFSLLPPLLDINIPISIVPALPMQEQFRIVQNTLESLLHKLHSNHQQFFLGMIECSREKKYQEIFTKNGAVKQELFWHYKKISFLYLQKTPIHKLFDKKKSIYILKSIRNELLSDSIDWVCFINEKSIYIFSLSTNHLLIWSPILKGLKELFLASILLDSTILDNLNNTSRWSLIDQIKTQLSRFLKRYFKKNSCNGLKDKSVIQRFTMLMNTFTVIQKCLLENINDILISTSIEEVRDIKKKYIQICDISFLEFISELENNPSITSLKEPSKHQVLHRIVQNLTQIDYEWVLDLHPVYFLEIAPQVYTEIEYRDTGEFYTPIALAESITATTLKIFVQQNLVKPITDVKIFDPAMGTGILLVFALEWLTNRMMSDVLIEDSFIDLRRKILNSCLNGNDIDRDSISIGNSFLNLFCMSGLEKPDILLNSFNRDFIEFFITQISTNKPFPKYEIILSNPPFLAFHSRFTKKSPLKKEELKTLQQLLPVFIGKRDNTYLLFLGICLQYFLNSNGVVGFIIDHSFLDLPSYKKIRHFLLSNYHLHYVLANYSYRKIAVVDLSLLIFSHQIGSKQKTIWQETLLELPQQISTNHFLVQPNYMFRYREIPNFLSRLQEKSVPLGKLVKISCGLEYGSLLKTNFLSTHARDNFYPAIDGSNGLPQPYFLFWVPGLTNSYVRFDKNYEKHLQDTNQNISRSNKRVFMISGSLERFLTPKIILRQTAANFIATFDQNQYLTLRNTHLIYCPEQPYSLESILGILNSSLGNYIGEYYNIIRKPKDKSSRYPQIRLNALKKFPIIDITRIDDDSIIQQLETAVRECLKIGESITEALTELWDIFQDSGFEFTFQRQFLKVCLSKNILESFSSEKQLDEVKIWKTVLQKKLSRLSSQKNEIDSIVYKLYNITRTDQQFIECYK
ncbi:MAG: TaqI-like C-terminal specificity domain-containing protein [Candidatus Hodarchaeales archaeon]|jgi:hypothetical protein